MVNFGPTADGAGPVPRPPVLSAQRQHHADAERRQQRTIVWARKSLRKRCCPWTDCGAGASCAACRPSTREGQPFWWPEADAALFQSLRNWMGPQVKLIELDLHINDLEFAQMAARTLLDFLRSLPR